MPFWELALATSSFSRNCEPAVNCEPKDIRQRSSRASKHGRTCGRDALERRVNNLPNMIFPFRLGRPQPEGCGYRMVSNFLACSYNRVSECDKILGKMPRAGSVSVTCRRKAMDPQSLQQRLSQISTAWTLMTRAHGGTAQAESAAQVALVERYQTAVYRYLLGAARDPDVADELFQEFALRLVRGDFGRADPKQGRFRDYVKSALINLVINYQKKQKRTPVVDLARAEPAVEDKQLFDADHTFLANWRAALLDRAWE